jgi:hypothetical protein
MTAKQTAVPKTASFSTETITSVAKTASADTASRIV